MSQSRFHCPSCEAKLQKELHPAKSKDNPTPYVQLYCTSRQCLSSVANTEGGSGPTEEAAYRSLIIVVDLEQCESLDGPSKEDTDDAKADKMADHQRKRSIGL